MVSLCSLVPLLGPLHPTAALGQETPAQAVDRILKRPPFDRAHWGILFLDESGGELYSRNADRLFVPASTTKLVVSAAASALLPPEFRIATSIYATGPIDDGVLDGNLVVYGRGDPSFSPRCYGLDTLAVGACDSLWTRIDALAGGIVARGIQHVTGAIVGDGSYFDGQLVHPEWDSYDLNWWYAAPVGALGFNDNSLDVTYGPGATVGAPVQVSFEPDLGFVVFENRTRTLPAGERRSIDFFREPGTVRIWANGGVPVGARERTEYFAVPDPNLYFVLALRAALARRGVSIAGPTRSTTDSTSYAVHRSSEPVAEVLSRSLPDMLFPILNSSQNWFAEMLLKVLGRQQLGEGTWRAGLEAEALFLIDSVGVDPAAFSLSDASGLSSGNLLTPRALVKLLAYMREHPNNRGFLRGLARSAERGSLRRRFVGTPLEGRVLAKTGSIAHVNSLAGYLENSDGTSRAFAVVANNHSVPYSAMIATIDSIVVALGH
jgi:D-alanyl-D-alanine carboxypeptidase/D-alanyl-D-alanine-endopeptidase (penicillin-binding protein 4)